MLVHSLPVRQSHFQVQVNQRLQSPVPLLENTRIPEVVEELVCPLESRIAHLAYLLGVEFPPPFPIEFPVQVLYVFGVDQVDEGVSHIAIVLNRRISTL